MWYYFALLVGCCTHQRNLLVHGIKLKACAGPLELFELFGPGTFGSVYVAVLGPPISRRWVMGIWADKNDFDTKKHALQEVDLLKIQSVQADPTRHHVFVINYFDDSRVRQALTFRRVDRARDRWVEILHLYVIKARDSRKVWLTSFKEKVLQEMTPDNSHTFLEEGGPPLALFLVNADDKPGRASGEAIFQPVEKELKDDFNMVRSDCSVFGSQFEVEHECPVLLIVDVESFEHEKYTMKNLKTDTVDPSARLAEWMRSTKAYKKFFLQPEARAQAANSTSATDVTANRSQPQFEETISADTGIYEEQLQKQWSVPRSTNESTDDAPKRKLGEKPIGFEACLRMLRTAAKRAEAGVAAGVEMIAQFGRHLAETVDSVAVSALGLALTALTALTALPLHGLVLVDAALFVALGLWLRWRRGVAQQSVPQDSKDWDLDWTGFGGAFVVRSS